MDEIGDGVEALATLKDPFKVWKLYYAKVAEQLAVTQQALAQTKTDMIVQLELNDAKYGAAGELMARAAAENMAESAGMSEPTRQAMKADNEKFVQENIMNNAQMQKQYDGQTWVYVHESGHVAIPNGRLVEVSVWCNPEGYWEGYTRKDYGESTH